MCNGVVRDYVSAVSPMTIIQITFELKNSTFKQKITLQI